MKKQIQETSFLSEAFQFLLGKLFSVREHTFYFYGVQKRRKEILEILTNFVVLIMLYKYKNVDLHIKILFSTFNNEYKVIYLLGLRSLLAKS